MKCCLIEPTLDAICELGIGQRNNAMVVRGGGEKSTVQTIAAVKSSATMMTGRRSIGESPKVGEFGGIRQQLGFEVLLRY